MREYKNDSSQVRICNYHGRQDSYYAAQVKFNNEDRNNLVKGYYLWIVNTEYDTKTRTVGKYNYFYSDKTLLVQCERRSERSFKRALDMMEENIGILVNKMESCKKDLDEMGIKQEEINEIINEIENSRWKEFDDMDVENVEEKIEKGVKEKEKKLTFDDVVGMTEIKQKLYDVVDQLNNKEKYEQWGITPINGMILYGVGGTGKSLLSEALAGEIDAEFIKITTSDIMDKYVGSSQKNTREIFERARSFDKCVLMIDEADGIFAKRNGENNKEHNNVVNEFLYQLSNKENKDVFVIATTNRLDIMDESIKRSGRFDYKIEVCLPDYETRKGILELNAKKKPIANDVDFGKIARNMAGMNGADCALLINESARKVLREKRNEITQTDLDFTLEQLVCGLESKSKKLDDRTKKIVATHETHHLLANELLKVNKTKKISILPHGSALGYLLHTNEDNEDIFLYNKEQLENRVKVMLAGRIGEELFFNRPTTGASDDLLKANNLIRIMVTKYGYSDELGLLVVEDNDVSLQDKVNDIVKNELNRLYEETRELLEQYKDLAQVIIDKLYLKEELDGKEVEEIISEFMKK